MKKNSKIYIAGHKGMVGQAVVGALKNQGYQNLVFKTSKELDLRDQASVESFMQKARPEYVFLFAAKVGGIKANINSPAQFLYDNVMIESNLIQAGYNCKVEKLLYLGSSCVYPLECPQPMKEEYLLSGKLEPTNEAYALAKIMGLKLCEYYNKQFGTSFISLMPANLYGKNDDFDLETSHVLAALLRKFHEAKIKQEPSVRVWGTGKVRREFLYVADLADACIHFMNSYKGNEIINIGLGEDVLIEELASLIKDIVGYQGKIVFDASQPSGMPRKLLDITRANKLGWKAKTALADGIKATYEWYKNE